MNVVIDKLVFEGWGIGTLEEGKKVLVKKSVPGDLLEIKITKERKNLAEASIEKVLKPGTARITPSCPYFENCGGCEHQNISFPNQQKFKSEIFAETLKRQGIDFIPDPIISGSSEPFYYRNSIRFFFVSDNENQISLSRHHFDYKEGFVPIESCLLQSKLSNQIIFALKNFINQNIEDKSTFWQLKIREGKATGQFMVEIITSSEILPNKEGIVAALKQFSEIKSIYQTIAFNKSLKNLRRRLLFGSATIQEQVGSFRFQISPESFFQTNSLGIKTLYDKIKEFAEISPKDTVLDLYCGTGTIGIYLSRLAGKVIGVESVPEAVRDAKDNARLNHATNCEFICQDTEKYLDKLNQLEIRNLKIILDPPRAGLTPQIIDMIAKLPFEHLIYVSCNPATFARDTKSFAGKGIKFMKIQPIDMFPQTHHIESVALLTKRGLG